MTAYTIQLLQVRVINPATAKGLHVANFSAQQLDLLDVWADYLDGLNGNAGFQKAGRYIVTESMSAYPTQRRVQAELDYGRFGTTRRIRTVSTGKVRDKVRSGEVASDGLRSLMVVPPNGKLALLAMECIGASSAAGMISESFKAFVHRLRVKARLDITEGDQARAWRDFLSGADLKEVDFEFVRRNDANRSGQTTIEHRTFQPTRGQSLPKEWIDQLRNRDIPPGQVVGADINDPDAVRVVVSHEGRRKTMRLGDIMPTFTTLISDDARPTDDEFYEEAESVIEDRLSQTETDPGS